MQLELSFDLPKVNLLFLRIWIILFVKYTLQRKKWFYNPKIKNRIVRKSIFVKITKPEISFRLCF
jgi:hypothetical protein